MNQIPKLFLIPAVAACCEQRGALSSFLSTSIIYLLLLIVVTTGCDTKKESANTSGNDILQTVSPSAETQKTTVSQEQHQPLEADNSISKEAQKSPREEQSSIKVTFVELGSVNCIPCKMMQPIMKEIEEEYKDQVKVVFHDVWTKEGNPYAATYKIRVIPTQVFLDKDGKEYFRHEGFFPKEQLVEVLKKQGIM